jgi:prepilin-type N-terminal cleavage/methylation domain-containing protein
MIKKVIKKKKGFTLIELLVVIAIIIVLAAILLPYIINRVEDSRISRMIGEIRSLKTAMLLFYNDLNSFTDNWNNLVVNFTPPHPNWRGPYIEKIATPLANTNTGKTNDTWQNASPWRTDFVLVTYSESDGFQFANQTGDEYTFVRAVALVVANPLVGGANAIPASSLRKIDTELDDGAHNSGFIVGASNIPADLTFTAAAYTDDNTSLVVLLQGLK